MFRGMYVFVIGVLVAVVAAMAIASLYPAPKAPGVALYSTKRSYTQNETLNKAWNTHESTELRYRRLSTLIIFVSGLFLGVVGLAITEKLPIVGDGLLLGGLFTIVYGIGIGMWWANGAFRLVVGAVGLCAAIAISYARLRASKA